MTTFQVCCYLCCHILSLAVPACHLQSLAVTPFTCCGHSYHGVPGCLCGPSWLKVNPLLHLYSVGHYSCVEDIRPEEEMSQSVKTLEKMKKASSLSSTLVMHVVVVCLPPVNCVTTREHTKPFY